jgi:hypothetical protein
MAIAIAIVVQGQTLTTDSALVAGEAELATWIETLPLGDNIGFLEALCNGRWRSGPG